MPYILRVALQNNTNNYLKEEYNYLKIFGNDFKTKDGYGVRDYIYVTDLA